MTVHKNFNIIFVKQTNIKYPFRMKRKVRIFLCFLFAVTFLSLTHVSGQILKDPVSLKLIKSGIDYVYNQQFEEAQEVYTKINITYPRTPCGFTVQGVDDVLERLSYCCFITFEGRFRKGAERLYCLM